MRRCDRRHFDRFYSIKHTHIHSFIHSFIHTHTHTHKHSPEGSTDEFEILSPRALQSFFQRINELLNWEASLLLQEVKCREEERRLLFYAVQIPQGLPKNPGRLVQELEKIERTSPWSSLRAPSTERVTPEARRHQSSSEKQNSGVQDAILEDLVFLTEIVAKRTIMRTDGFDY